MRVLIATDAWHPQVNGVVRTLTSLAKSMASLGATVDFLTPEGFPSFPLPTYPDLRLAIPSRREIARRIEQAAPDAIHIATEGTIGYMARAYCMRRGLPFTTSYTTRFPEYISARAPIPESWSYAALRRFHSRRDGDDGFDRFADGDLAPARLRQSRHVDARRRHRAVPARSRDRAGFAATDLRDRRTDRGREEPRGFSFARPAGHQGRDRRRSAGGRTAAASFRT